MNKEANNKFFFFEWQVMFRVGLVEKEARNLYEVKVS